jgi:hypothetical protein
MLLPKFRHFEGQNFKNRMSISKTLSNFNLLKDHAGNCGSFPHSFIFIISFYKILRARECQPNNLTSSFGLIEKYGDVSYSLSCTYETSDTLKKHL